MKNFDLCDLCGADHDGQCPDTAPPALHVNTRPRAAYRLPSEPWNEHSCTLVALGRQIAIQSLRPGETLCSGCWGCRATCGGLPRSDGATP